MLENILRWAWGTLLTAIVTAVLTMFLKHGRRWFRGARKFIRTGRWASGPDARWRSSASLRSAQGSVRAPRLTMEQRFMMFLARMNGKSVLPAPPANGATAPGNDVPLDLRF